MGGVGVAILARRGAGAVAMGQVRTCPPRGPEPAADGWAADPQAKHAAVEARWRPLWEAPGATLAARA